MSIMWNADKFTNLSNQHYISHSLPADESLKVKHIRLIILVKNQCRQEEINEMKKELTCKMSEFHMTIDNVMPEIYHKQHVICSANMIINGYHKWKAAYDCCQALHLVKTWHLLYICL